MKLLGVEKDGGWLYSEWNLTYRVGWENICRAAALIYQYTSDPEIIVGDADGDRRANVNDENDVMSLDEYGRLTIRGVSRIIKVPLSITFFNQLDFVRATVACATEEFAEADYKNFNLSMCQFMDSAELAMY
ncbi:MAG: hypothetical protein IKX86_06510 [Clostridia bacterium]|nr:hypothetical protein [Clostridia bacterium]MBR5768306.1 hypothetical protein [Clostridia bacterium]